MLSLRTISKSFSGPDGDVRALENVSLDLEGGEFVAVQGPSGCGKSTLLAIAGALLKPDAGTVVIEGVDPYSLDSEARAKFRAERIGFVFQQFHLLPYLDVLDNVLAPSIAKPGKELQERAKSLLTRFGLGHRLHHVPGQLSTGEKQRTALARALLLGPKVILADEPTGNLDEASGSVVLGDLRAFAADGGSVLLVTHDPRAAAVADRVVNLTAASHPIPA